MLAGLFAGACSALTGGPDTGPSGGFPDVEGRWSGTFRTPSCTVSAPPLEGYCAELTTADPVPFVLTLAQFEAEASATGDTALGTHVIVEAAKTG